MIFLRTLYTFFINFSVVLRVDNRCAEAADRQHRERQRGGTNWSHFETVGRIAIFA